MSSPMDEARVRHVARLARLRVDDQEVARFASDLSEILDYVALLNELDTEHVPPTTHATAAANVLRDDQVAASWDQRCVLTNAPQAESGFFRVPKVLDRDHN